MTTKLNVDAIPDNSVDSSKLVSSSIKTINNTSLLGSGDISLITASDVATTSMSGLMSYTDKGRLDTLHTQYRGFTIPQGYGKVTDNPTPLWMHLLDFNIGSLHESIIVDVYWGDGYNGRANQNEWWRIFIKRGWQSTASATATVGVTVHIFGGEKDDNSTAKVICNAAGVGQLWLCCSSLYMNGKYRYLLNCDHDTPDITVTNVCSFQKDSPSLDGYIEQALKVSLMADTTDTVAAADKWATARTVSGGVLDKWSFTFDGSKDVTASNSIYACTMNSGSKANYPYHRIASINVTRSYSDSTLILLISENYVNGGYGIVRIDLRTDNSETVVSSARTYWLVRSNLSANCIQLGLYNVWRATYLDVFFYTTKAYIRATARVLSSGYGASLCRSYTLYDSYEDGDSTSTSKGTNSYECYASIAAAGQEIHGQDYTNDPIVADLGGIVNHANYLVTSRTLQVNLASTAAASFNGSANASIGVTGILPVANGGTGLSTLTSGYALIGNGTSAVSLRAISNNTSVGVCGVNSNLMTVNHLAYWNGAYGGTNNTSSNLAYCVKGAFGSFAVKSSLAFSELTSKPTTLSGYGITDGLRSVTQPTDSNVFVTAVSTDGTAITYTKSYTKKSLSAVGTSGWTDLTTAKLIIPDMSFIAYWNGAYSGTTSNLNYCKSGTIIGSNGGTMSGALTVNALLTASSLSVSGQASVGSLKIGDATISWDSTNSILTVDKSLYTGGEDNAYGVRWFYGVSPTDPQFTDGQTALLRIGNATYHQTLPVQSLMRGCLLDDDGNVVEYLSGSWLDHDLSGASGQVMVEVPGTWWRFSESAWGAGVDRRALVSLEEFEGAFYVPKFYVGAYEASYDANNKMQSAAGVLPKVSQSLTAFRTAARKRNTANTKWNVLPYLQYKVLFWLYMIEYANRNVQLTFNSARDANGCKQGGLGIGVTNVSSWSAWTEFNNNGPFVVCGTSDSLGDESGDFQKDAADYTNGEKTLTTNDSLVHIPRYRGIENIFGHIWTFIDGIRVYPATSASVRPVYTTDDPSKFAAGDSSVSGWSNIGNESGTQAYVKKLIFGAKGEIMASVVGGGSTTYWADYHYAGGSGLKAVLFGGGAHYGSPAGLGASHSNFAPSYAYSSIGSRLCFLP